MSVTAGNNIVEKSKEIISLLQSKLGQQLLASDINLGDAVIHIRPGELLNLFGILKLDSQFQFNLLVDVTAVDWLDSREDRFEIIYHLYSHVTKFRLRVKVNVPETALEVDSICSLWSGANFMEREVWDMYGIKFKGHPDLRRILMYDEFDGHPLRKDYPVQGKQPRIPLRAPEVRNTALDMIRPALVQINRKKDTEAHA